VTRYLDRAAERHSDPDGPGPGDIRGVASVPLNCSSVETTEPADESRLACDMIAVHGIDAPAVARGNARSAALAGQDVRAKSWVRVLAIMQQRQRAIPRQGSGNSDSTQG
jgi:hypothetical protein